jgi:uncharacterized short protein YbdD (DUF466 family)
MHTIKRKDAKGTNDYADYIEQQLAVSPDRVASPAAQFSDVRVANPV